MAYAPGLSDPASIGTNVPGVNPNPRLSAAARCMILSLTKVNNKQNIRRPLNPLTLQYGSSMKIISAVDNASMILQPVMIVAVIAGGVRHFYASEWNSDIAQREIHGMRYFRHKQAVRAYLREMLQQALV